MITNWLATGGAGKLFDCGHSMYCFNIVTTSNTITSGTEAGSIVDQNSQNANFGVKS